jgi:hypothetical protein
MDFPSHKTALLALVRDPSLGAGMEGTRMAPGQGTGEPVSGAVRGSTGTAEASSAAGRCIRCHRPLKREGVDGLGPKCFAKVGKPAIPEHGRDLFGFDVEAAAQAASERVMVHIQSMAVDAAIAVRHSFAAARRRLGVWA